MFHEASSLSLSGILPRPANRERPDETLLFSVTLFRFLRNGYFSANPYTRPAPLLPRPQFMPHAWYETKP
jgi:hypothetical protein